MDIKEILTPDKIVVSAFAATFTSLLDNVFGINLWLFVFIFFGLWVEFVLGIRVALKEKKAIEPGRIWDWLIKFFMILFILFMVRSMGNGIHEQAIKLKLDNTALYIDSIKNIIHLFVTFLVCIYVMQSVIDNWAALGNKIALKLAAMLRIQVKKVESLADVFDLTGSDNTLPHSPEKSSDK